MKMDKFKKGDLVRFLFKYDVSEIIKVLPDDTDPIWNFDRRRESNTYWGFTQTKSIIFKWFNDPNFEWKCSTVDIRPYVETFHENTELWKTIKPICDKLEKYYDGYAARVIIANLPSGCSLEAHKDGDCILVPFVNRNHIVLETNPEVDFIIQDSIFKFTVGDVYEIDNISKHTAINRSQFRRLHLIIDVLPSDFKSAIIEGEVGMESITIKYGNEQVAIEYYKNGNGSIFLV